MTLLQMYGKVEELEEKVKRRGGDGELKFVGEDLYERHKEYYDYGSFRGLLFSRKKNNAKQAPQMMETPSNATASAGSSLQQEELVPMECDILDSNLSETNNKEGKFLDVGDTTTTTSTNSSPDEPEPPFLSPQQNGKLLREQKTLLQPGINTSDNSSASLLPEPTPDDNESNNGCNGNGTRRRRSERIRNVKQAYAESTSSSSSTEDDMRNGDSDVDVSDDEDEDDVEFKLESTEETPSSSDSDSDNASEAAHSDIIGGVKGHEPSMDQEDLLNILRNDYCTTKNDTTKKSPGGTRKEQTSTLHQMRYKRNLVVKQKVGKARSTLTRRRRVEGRRSVHPITRSGGLCPVCEKPMSSVARSNTAYQAHRLSHLSESERAEATSNPLIFGNGKGQPHRSQPRFPRVETRRKITPESAPLHGDVNQCSTCGKFITGGATGLRWHEHSHLPPHEQKETNLCSICGSSFRWKCALYKHTLRKHSKHYRCKECYGNRVFRTEKALEEHMRRNVHYSRKRRPRRDGKMAAGGRRQRTRRTPKLPLLPAPQIEKLPFPCTQCPESFDTWLKLRNHVSNSRDHVHDNDNAAIIIIGTYTCKLGKGRCMERLFKSEEERLEHYAEAHPTSKLAVRTPDEALLCKFPDCKMRFPDEASLKGHVGLEHEAAATQRPSSKGRMCSLCGRIVKGRSTFKLKEHHRLVHAGERRHGCPHCSSSFGTPLYLNRHLSAVHGTGPYSGSFKCEQPGCSDKKKVKVYPCRLRYAQHLREVHKIYATSGKAIKGKSKDKPPISEINKKSETEERHPNDDSNTSGTSYQCSKCGTRLNDEGSMRKHARKCRGKNAQSAAACSTCGKVLANARRLREHQVVHTGERRHVCHVCNCSFTHRSARNSHLAIWHGIGPSSGTFSCEESGCNKVYKCRITYRGHMRKVHKVYADVKGKGNNKSKDEVSISETNKQ